MTIEKMTGLRGAIFLYYGEKYSIIILYDSSGGVLIGEHFKLQKNTLSRNRRNRLPRFYRITDISCPERI